MSSGAFSLPPAIARFSVSTTTNPIRSPVSLINALARDDHAVGVGIRGPQVQLLGAAMEKRRVAAMVLAPRGEAVFEHPPAFQAQAHAEAPLDALAPPLGRRTGNVEGQVDRGEGLPAAGRTEHYGETLFGQDVLDEPGILEPRHGVLSEHQQLQPRVPRRPSRASSFLPDLQEDAIRRVIQRAEALAGEFRRAA
jgi:hypothetical protein